MSWLESARDLEAAGIPHVIVTVLGTRGSTPRDNGAKMVVTADKEFCTIGGGHLEFRSIEIARDMLLSGESEQRLESFPLGPRLGQCCGGTAHVLLESFPGHPVNLMLFGAGHVGKALVTLLGELPCQVRWVDSRSEQFPARLPANVKTLESDTPAEEVASMPPGSYYLVMTHNHPLDFDISAAVVGRGDARYIGLIGSETKWRRFKMRFEHRGYPEHACEAVRCPVGLAAVPGKLPMEVAISIAGELIAEYQGDLPPRQNRRGVGWRELQPLMSDSSRTPRAAASEADSESSVQSGESLDD